MDPSVPLIFIALFCTILVLMAGLIGMAIVIDLKWPGGSDRALHAYQDRARRCYVVGVVNALFLSLATILFFSTQVLALVGLLTLAMTITLIAAGYGAAFRSLGQRFITDNGTSARAKCILIGGLITVTAFLVPVAGWGYALLVMLRGLGAATIAVLTSRQARRSVTVQSPRASDDRVPSHDPT